MSNQDSPRFAVRALSGERYGEVVPIRGRLEFGRAPTCEVQLLESGISRAHAAIVMEGDGYVLMDLLSTNGTVMGKDKVTRHELRPGDRFRIASSEFVFERFGGDPVGADRPAVSGRDTWEQTRLAVPSELEAAGLRDGTLRDSRTYPGNLFKDVATFRELQAKVQGDGNVPEPVRIRYARMADRLGATPPGSDERRAFARYACDYPAQIAFAPGLETDGAATIVEISVDGAKVRTPEPHRQTVGTASRLRLPVVTAEGLKSYRFACRVVWADERSVGVMFDGVPPLQEADVEIVDGDTEPVSMFDLFRRS